MTHVYQPIMIRKLLESEDCRATREAIARQFLGMDESQLNYYKAITARWPHKTLKEHRIVRYERRGQVYTLLLDGATAEQKKRLTELCDLRLHEFIDRDPAIRRLREYNRRSRSGSLRYDVLAKSRGFCAACGISSAESLLHVDHIRPISLEGQGSNGQHAGAVLQVQHSEKGQGRYGLLAVAQEAPVQEARMFHVHQRDASAWEQPGILRSGRSRRFFDSGPTKARTVVHGSDTCRTKPLRRADGTRHAMLEGTARARDRF